MCVQEARPSVGTLSCSCALITRQSEQWVGVGSTDEGIAGLQMGKFHGRYSDECKVQEEENLGATEADDEEAAGETHVEEPIEETADGAEPAAPFDEVHHPSDI